MYITPPDGVSDTQRYGDSQNIVYAPTTYDLVDRVYEIWTSLDGYERGRDQQIDSLSAGAFLQAVANLATYMDTLGGGKQVIPEDARIADLWSHLNDQITIGGRSYVQLAEEYTTGNTTAAVNSLQDATNNLTNMPLPSIWNDLKISFPEFNPNPGKITQDLMNTIYNELQNVSISSDDASLKQLMSDLSTLSSLLSGDGYISGLSDIFNAKFTFTNQFAGNKTVTASLTDIIKSYSASPPDPDALTNLKSALLGTTTPGGENTLQSELLPVFSDILNYETWSSG